MANLKPEDDPYAKWLIKPYFHWALFLNEDQRYLGRAYLWLLREGGMQRFSEITDAENAELRIAIREYEQALEEIWQPDFMNYAWLANLIVEHGGHGHLHLIPRYQRRREFAGITFLDGRWGKNYVPSKEFRPPEEVLINIRDTLKRKMVP
jgi:diadenosine tetraphosphate (Ap4A) HIT family hydrolase